MTLKYNSLPRKTLAEPLTSSATFFRLNNITKWDGTDLAEADFGTEAYGVLRDAKGTVVEFFAFDPATIADADIDFTYRGLAYNGTNLTTEIAGNKLEWGKGSIVELGTHGPQIFQWLQELIEGIAVSGSPDATLIQKGLVEIATTAEISAGTAIGSTTATLVMSPDQFIASSHGTRTLVIEVFRGNTDVLAGDGAVYIVVPEALNGMDIVRATGQVVTAGTTGATTIDIYNVTDSVDVLSVPISIASGDKVGTAGTINTSNDSIATDDLLRIDITSGSSTAAKGLVVVIEARLP